jgi:hypothetical protein
MFHRSAPLFREYGAMRGMHYLTVVDLTKVYRFERTESRCGSCLRAMPDWRRFCVTAASGVCRDGIRANSGDWSLMHVAFRAGSSDRSC